MRGQLLRFETGFAVINDSYNSNPAALRAMMELLAHTAGYRRRILAAGEMLELGPASASLHRETGAAAAALNLDWIVAVQGNAAEIAAGAIDAGMPPERARFFADFRGSCRICRRNRRAGRSPAGQRFARSEDGARGGSFTRAVSARESGPAGHRARRSRADESRRTKSRRRATRGAAECFISWFITFRRAPLTC